MQYLTPIAMILVLLHVSANITAQKLTILAGIPITAAIYFFPLSDVLIDIVTEVYGYARSRILIWMSVLCNVLVALLLQFTVWLPAWTSWHEQASFEAILAAVPRMVLASTLALWAGEFGNSYLLAKLKVRCRGKWLWLRALIANAVGLAVDSFIFMLVAFWGWQPLTVILQAGLMEYWLKIATPILVMPLTYWAVAYLKKAEAIDFYDEQTNFNPFFLRFK